MCLELLQRDWDEFFNSRDPSHCWSLVESAIREYLDRTCPMKVFKVNEAREQWVTNETLEEIKDKDLLIKIAKRSGKADDWDRVKLARNRLGRLVEQAKAGESRLPKRTAGTLHEFPYLLGISIVRKCLLSPSFITFTCDLLQLFLKTVVKVTFS